MENNKQDTMADELIAQGRPVENGEEESGDSDEYMAPNLKTKGIMTVIAGTSIMFFLGSFFLWSNIAIYVLSYFYLTNKDINVGFIPLVDTILKFCLFWGYLIGMYLLQNRRVSPKIVLLIGSSLSLGGILLSSFTHDLPTFLSFYSGMNGLGNGICYMVPLVCGWEYFPKRKGLVSGICLSAYGFSSFVFSLISTSLVNPKGEKATIVLDENTTLFAADVAERVPFML